MLAFLQLSSKKYEKSVTNISLELPCIKKTKESYLSIAQIFRALFVCAPMQFVSSLHRGERRAGGICSELPINAVKSLLSLKVLINCGLLWRREKSG